MHFLFDFDNFPITDELINNVRLNQGRITPFDANNGGIYNIVDVLRNNAYGLYGQYQNFANTLDGDTWTFGESGGPANGNGFTPPAQPVQGAAVHREGQRSTGRPTGTTASSIGGEFTQYNIDNYTFRLQDKFFSDAYREKPIRWNGFVEDRLDLGDVVVVGGLRYDYYDTRASPARSRPTRWATPTRSRAISSMPGFDQTNPTSHLRARTRATTT